MNAFHGGIRILLCYGSCNRQYIDLSPELALGIWICSRNDKSFIAYDLSSMGNVCDAYY
jgi:hypothetical protein